MLRLLTHQPINTGETENFAEYTTTITQQDAWNPMGNFEARVVRFSAFQIALHVWSSYKRR